MKALLPFSLGCFAIGAPAMLAFTFFSPGIHSEGPWGYGVAGFGVATLICLSFAAAKVPVGVGRCGRSGCAHGTSSLPGVLRCRALHRNLGPFDATR